MTTVENAEPKPNKYVQWVAQSIFWFLCIGALEWILHAFMHHPQRPYWWIHLVGLSAVAPWLNNKPGRVWVATVAASFVLSGIGYVVFDRLVPVLHISASTERCCEAIISTAGTPCGAALVSYWLRRREIQKNTREQSPIAE